MTQLLVAIRKSNYTFMEGIFSWQEKGVKLSTVVHSCMAGYGPKDSPRPVLPTVSRMCTDQTRENYQCELISLSRAQVETELTSYLVEPSSESSESIFE